MNKPSEQPHWTWLSNAYSQISMVHRPHENKTWNEILYKSPLKFSATHPSFISYWVLASMKAPPAKPPCDAHTRMDSDLHARGTIPTASTIRPIEDWSTDDVWTLPAQTRLGQRHAQPLRRHQPGPLHALPRSQPGGECPGHPHDPSQQTCAGSRFGCRTCTVVAEDESLNQAMICNRERRLRRDQTLPNWQPSETACATSETYRKTEFKAAIEGA